jgi:hypothetical protein
VVARAYTGRAATPTLAFPVFLLKKKLNAVLYLSELSDQLDVTHKAQR